MNDSFFKWYQNHESPVAVKPMKDGRIDFAELHRRAELAAQKHAKANPSDPFAAARARCAITNFLYELNDFRENISV